MPSRVVNVMVHELRFTPERFAALIDVYRGRVRFDNGLGTGAGTGYRWNEHVGTTMSQEKRDVLFELWQLDLIDVNTSHIFASHGHEVTITHAGWSRLRRWGFVPEEHAA